MTADRDITIGSHWQDAYGDEWRVTCITRGTVTCVTLTMQSDDRAEAVTLTDTALWAGYERVEYV